MCACMCARARRAGTSEWRAPFAGRGGEVTRGVLHAWVAAGTVVRRRRRGGDTASGVLHAGLRGAGAAGGRLHGVGGGGVHALLCDHEWAANGGLHAPLHWGGLFAGVCAVLRRGGLLAGGLQPLLAAKGGGCIPCCTVVGAAGGRLYAPLHWGVLLAGFCTWMRLRAPFCKWGFAHLIAEGGLQAGVCMRDCMGVVQVGVCTWEFA